MTLLCLFVVDRIFLSSNAPNASGASSQVKTFFAFIFEPPEIIDLLFREIVIAQHWLTLRHLISSFNSALDLNWVRPIFNWKIVRSFLSLFLSVSAIVESKYNKIARVAEQSKFAILLFHKTSMMSCVIRWNNWRKKRQQRTADTNGDRTREKLIFNMK